MQNSEMNDQRESTGPWPFITRHVLIHLSGKRTVLRSRSHRKRLKNWRLGGEEKLPLLLLRSLWMPSQLNWWIASIFALGAVLFALGSVLVLLPGLARDYSLDERAVSSIFFAGSIPFTLAAYLQLYQSANAGEFSADKKTPLKRRQCFGWKPHDIGWLSCALQFLGTILFNINTFDALLSGLSREQQNLLIWAPNIVGSMLFLTSGYLAFIETCHAHWAWKLGNLSWWVTFVNLIGCVAFMASALFAFVPAKIPGFEAATISVFFTLIGAIGFFLGSLLMLPESAISETAA